MTGRKWFFNRTSKVNWYHPWEKFRLKLGPTIIHSRSILFSPPTELITEITCSLGLGLLTFNHYLCTPISDIRHGLSRLYDPVWGSPIDLMGWSGIFRLTSCSLPKCIWGIVLSHLMSSKLAFEDALRFLAAGTSVILHPLF
ncbi:hypothetical protein C8J57DRAFT_1255431 [Mycena rebaudengoi]|nr:hypothetical protein C8J57DRAFT_1255431 [Mycena rebaudengoi]